MVRGIAVTCNSKQAAEAVIEGYEAQAVLNQQLQLLASQIGEADSKVPGLAFVFQCFIFYFGIAATINALF